MPASSAPEKDRRKKERFGLDAEGDTTCKTRGKLSARLQQTADQVLGKQRPSLAATHHSDHAISRLTSSGR